MTNAVLVETVIDVRTLAPREKHPTIFKAWTELDQGDALVLINDHDPLPLYYQLACEHEGTFRWDYLERGPDLWRVRISKGDFADPGFVPIRKTEPTRAAPMATLPAPHVIDTRPIFGQGQTPCQAIDEGVASLVPGQTLVLLVPFEPIPLYSKLGKQGFRYQSKQLTDGTWRAEFSR